MSHAKTAVAYAPMPHQPAVQQPVATESKPSFADLHLIAPLLKALQTEGYTHPTPIQAQAIPVALSGRDIFGSAQTGTGKTAAFALPILQNLVNNPLPKGQRRVVRALILAPTRELAVQISDSFAAYGRHTGLTHTAIYGGVSQRNQTDALHRGVDILVATPGRLMDLMGQGYVHLQHVQNFVLDEADRMLDMGFIHDINKIVAKLPAKKQTLFFSATLPLAIRALADNLLNKPATISVSPPNTITQTVQHQLYYVPRTDKRKLLVHIIRETNAFTLLVFTRTKHGADRLARDLNRADITAQALHGDKTQRARQQALDGFKRGKVQVLVATDIAARGIDVDDLSLVINYDLPNEPETYVHRIGRTGRAGAQGKAISFCDTEEKSYLRAIVKLLGKPIPVMETPKFAPDDASMPAAHTETPYKAEPSTKQPQLQSHSTGAPHRKPFRKGFGKRYGGQGAGRAQ
jgi:ATP-dependent RNA helicase RhlE